MKLIVNCHIPWSIAHGGMQTQIAQTWAALEKVGISVEPLRWWDEKQTGDILHHFGAFPPLLIDLARRKGWKVVNSILLSETCNRSTLGLWLRKILIRSVLAAPLPQGLQLPWRAFRMADHVVVCLEAERRVLVDVYGVAERSVTAVPLGLTEAFLNARPGTRSENHLICHGTIAPVKRSLELARWARVAQVPVLFVGKPFDLGSPYWEQFRQVVDNKFVKHHAHVDGEQGMVELLRQARGFVLTSRFENWSLSAHEAAACGLPLLLSDQRWAHERFGAQASYLDPRHEGRAVAALRRFYEQCPSLAAPRVHRYGWKDAAEILQATYNQLLGPTARS